MLKRLVVICGLLASTSAQAQAAGPGQQTRPPTMADLTARIDSLEERLSEFARIAQQNAASNQKYRIGFDVETLPYRNRENMRCPRNKVLVWFDMGLSGGFPDTDRYEGGCAALSVVPVDSSDPAPQPDRPPRP